MKNKKKPIRGTSIARKLNAALTRRSFAKTFFIDILAASLIMLTWCLTVENANGGTLFNVRARTLTGNTDVIYNTLECGRDLVRYVDDLRCGYKPSGGITLPFEDIYYQFAVVDTKTVEEKLQTETAEMTEPEITAREAAESEPAEETEMPVPVYEIEVIQPSVRYCTVDASVILTLVCGGFVILFVLQALSAVIRSLSGGGLIKRYLRPIDDIALMAEQLSSEQHTTTGQAVRGDASREMTSSSADDGTIDAGEVQSLTDAIDSIADSRGRIDMHATELGGLEAAVNNMLKRLEESRRKQIRFVDDASHELRTPIAVIQGYANMLDRWGKDDPKIRDEAIEAIQSESEHMKTLLDQLLFLARGEMDRHVMELVPLSVDQLLMEIMEESQMIDKKHIYEVSLASFREQREDENISQPKNTVLICADTAMIKQCIRILCDNAVRYTPEGGTITFRANERVSADEKGSIRREVTIEVADTGVGISAEELPRIFDRFYRGENARADNTGGSGLGLSIARWIVEQHKGRIEAISSPGIGTRMTIILPAYTEE